MYFVAAVLLVLSGLFYAAGHHEIGSVGVEMCRYGSICQHPIERLAFTDSDKTGRCPRKIDGCEGRKLEAKKAKS